MPARPAFRSRLLAALAFLLCGLLCTIAISWAAAARVDFYRLSFDERKWAVRPRDIPHEPRYICLERTDRFAATFWSLTFLTPLKPLESEPADEDIYQLAPPWARALMEPTYRRADTWPEHAPAPNGAVSREVVAVFAYGWPARALWRSAVARRPYRPVAYDTFGTLVVKRHPSHTAFTDIQLPGRPLWTGLLVDTLLFAAFLAAAFQALTRFLLLLRARRGHCRRCNYNLHGLAPGTPCPECGRR